MITGVVLVIVAAVLFCLAYMSKRRFGVLTLAMAAGFIISTYDMQSVAEWLNQQEVSFGVISNATVVSMAMILLPSLLLFFGGPTYATKKHRIVGSIFYAVAALLFCLGALEHSLVLVGQEKVVFSYVWEYREQALVVLLLLALIDVFLIHTIKRRKSAD